MFQNKPNLAEEHTSIWGSMFCSFLYAEITKKKYNQNNCTKVKIAKHKKTNEKKKEEPKRVSLTVSSFFCEFCTQNTRSLNIFPL